MIMTFNAVHRLKLE